MRTEFGRADEREIDQLLSKCLHLLLECEFEEIWGELYADPIVVGPPIRFGCGARPELRVPLANGAQLVFDLHAKIAFLRRPRARGPRPTFAASVVARRAGA
jgi:hypothetical protein